MKPSRKVELPKRPSLPPEVTEFCRMVARILRRGNEAPQGQGNEDASIENQAEEYTQAHRPK